MTRAGHEGKNNLAGFARELGKRLAEQVKLKPGNPNFKSAALNASEWDFFDVGVDEHQDGILAFGGFAEQGIDRRIRRAQPREFGAVEKTRVIADQAG